MNRNARWSFRDFEAIFGIFYCSKCAIWRGNKQKRYSDLIKKCELKDGESCHKIAYHYANGSSDSPRFFKADSAKKEAYLTKGCNGGFAQSCYILGLINYDNFYKKNGDKNKFRQKSKQFIKRACDLGFEKACGENWDLP